MSRPAIRPGDRVRIAPGLSMIGGKAATVLRVIEGDNGCTVSLDGGGVGWYVPYSNLELESAPVDVLAVMRAAVMVTESHGLNETAWGLSDACAAVAELYAERDRLANIVRDHEAQIRRMTAERAELVEAARGLADEVRKMERPWHLSGGAEEYGFDSGKSNAAELVEKKIRAALAKFGGA